MGVLLGMFEVVVCHWTGIDYKRIVASHVAVTCNWTETDDDDDDDEFLRICL